MSVVSAALRLPNANQAWLKAREERQDVVAPELLTKDSGAALINAVNLEHVRQIQTNGL